MAPIIAELIELVLCFVKVVTASGMGFGPRAVKGKRTKNLLTL
jgi:hypothetical protein